MTTAIEPNRSASVLLFRHLQNRNEIQFCSLHGIQVRLRVQCKFSLLSEADAPSASLSALRQPLIHYHERCLRNSSYLYSDLPWSFPYKSFWKFLRRSWRQHLEINAYDPLLSVSLVPYSSPKVLNLSSNNYLELGIGVGRHRFRKVNKWTGHLLFGTMVETNEERISIRWLMARCLSNCAW